ncbi:hypothetical protein C8Q75DRAFT_762457 [Abortiporus biennis]|nr:hypothetical protein C8Q75DRAFT_762457 [Abortiporus biennis]
MNLSKQVADIPNSRTELTSIFDVPASQQLESNPPGDITKRQRDTTKPALARCNPSSRVHSPSLFANS